MDEEHFKNFMNSVHLRQLYDTGVDAEYGDHLITLSTCEYTYTNGRFVVLSTCEYTYTNGRFVVVAKKV